MAAIAGDSRCCLWEFSLPEVVAPLPLGIAPWASVTTSPTKPELAAKLVQWMASIVQQAGKSLWVVVDGFYTKRSFWGCIVGTVVVVGRLRKDARLYDPPPMLRRRQRPGPGRPRKYGRHRIRLATRAAQKRGWETVECMLYGQTLTKTYKTFLATSRTVAGVIRVVLVKENQGWLAFYCTNPEANVREIIETFADRATIEQDFHDVKEVWGAGQQQVRNIWTNVAVYHLNLWMHTLVELGAWGRSHQGLCDRKDSPWDDASRRPSHANRRNALRRLIFETELSTITGEQRLPRKIVHLARRLVNLAA